MKLPKTPWGTRYASSTDYNTRAQFVQPNAGNAIDGTPLPEILVACTWANVSQWRGKQEDKPQSLQAVSSYKIVIHYPKTWNVDAGMNVLVNGQRHNIDSFLDPDGNKNELHCWTWIGDEVVVNS
jgi:SPP1 family predicted phage head-tail adaptor